MAGAGTTFRPAVEFFCVFALEKCCKAMRLSHQNALHNLTGRSEKPQHY